MKRPPQAKAGDRLKSTRTNTRVALLPTVNAPLDQVRTADDLKRLSDYDMSILELVNEFYRPYVPGEFDPSFFETIESKTSEQVVRQELDALIRSYRDEGFSPFVLVSLSGDDVFRRLVGGREAVEES